MNTLRLEWLSARLKRVVLHAVLIAGAAVSLFPFLWMVLTSLKSYVEASAARTFFPTQWLFSNYVEAWNRRATLYFLKKDYENAMADLREVLAREPRHFGALAGLGTILNEFGDEKHALEAFRKALDVYPRLNGVADEVRTLKEKVEGRDI